MDNINYTYFMGPLASNNFLSHPLTEDARNEFKNWIENIINKNITTLSKENRIIINKFLTDLDWIYGEYAKDGSLAKLIMSIYKANNMTDIIRFKSVINSVILLEDIKKRANVKYENFLREISERDRHANVIMPDNIKILTWNRGINLERAFYDISKNSETMFKELQVYPISAGFDDTDFDIRKFAILHLAGLAGTYYISKNGMISEYLKDWITIKNMSDADILNNLVISYKSFMYNDLLIPTVSFFLDNNNYTSLILQKAHHIASKTNILIIIGHLFLEDTFEKDKGIIQQMIDLHKIYVQVPTEYKQAVLLKLQNIRPDLHNIEVEFVDNDDDFFIHNDVTDVYEEF